MKPLTVKEIALACNGTATGDTTIKNVSIDSREITEDCLFIAIKGENFDGHNFIEKAIENGAKAVMAEKEIDCDVPVILVKSTRKAFLNLAGYYKSLFKNLKTVGITGSVGKTTTKEMTYAVLSQKYKTLKNEGNLNNEIGLPKVLLKLDDSYKMLISEMGMSALGEIEALTKTSRPDVSIITNIGISHIENLGSRENILKAKLEILKGMPEDGTLILNGDNDLLSTAELPNKIKPIYFGIENSKCDILAKDIRATDNQTTFKVIYNNSEEGLITIPTVGIHNVYNALSAIACGLCFGVSIKSAAEGLINYKSVGLRQKLTDHNGIKFIEDCYNASPDSMKAALNTLANMQCNKKIAVLGDMLELGDFAKQAHYDVGAYTAEKEIDILFSYGENSDNMVKGAKDNGIKEAYAFDDKNAMAEEVKKQISSGDCVLFKASRGIKMEEVIEKIDLSLRK